MRAAGRGNVTVPGFGQPPGTLNDSSPPISQPGEMSYEQLLQLRPVSHTEGILPARYLSPNETLLYSARPSFIGFALPGMIGVTAAFTLLVAFIWVLGDFTSLGSEAVSLLIVLLAWMIVAGVGGALARWWFACYAVTTSRILVKQGSWTRRIIDIPHGAVQSVMFEETGTGRAFDYGTLQFSSASVAGFSYSRMSSRPGVITWTAAPHPLETRAFYEMVKRAQFE